MLKLTHWAGPTTAAIATRHAATAASRPSVAPSADGGLIRGPHAARAASDAVPRGRAGYAASLLTLELPLPSAIVRALYTEVRAHACTHHHARADPIGRQPRDGVIFLAIESRATQEGGGQLGP